MFAFIDLSQKGRAKLKLAEIQYKSMKSILWIKGIKVSLALNKAFRKKFNFDK